MNIPRARRIIFFVLLLAAALAAFRPGIDIPMTLDMRMTTYNNSMITEPGGIWRIFRGELCGGCRVDAPVDISTGFYRPLVSALLWVEYRIAGTNDAIYNLDEILFHWACALMVFFLAARLLPQEPLLPYIAATLFALHPANAYAATRDVRADLLCLLFYLGALIAYLRAFPPGAPPRKRFILLALACFLGAMLSKEMGVTLPAVLVMLHFRQRFGEGRPPRELLYTLPFWILFAAYMAVRSTVFTQETLNPYLLVYQPHVLYINVIKSFPIYILRYFLPVGAEYPTLLPKMINVIDPAFADPQIYLSLALGILITAAALLNIRRHPTAAFLTFFLLITMTPLTMVTRITDVTDIDLLNTPERFMYIPSVPLLLLAALFLQNAYNRLRDDWAKKGAAFAGVGVALFLGIQSNRHTVATDSEMAVLKYFYLLPEERLTPRMRITREYLYAQLVAVPMHNYAEAERRLEKIARENPAVASPHVALGFIYLITDRRELIPPLLSRWNNLTPGDIAALARQNPTVLSEYFGIYNHIPFLLGVAASQRGEAREAADFFCSALRRGHIDGSVLEGLRENYLLNGPPQCRNAKDEALCRKTASVPDFAEWRDPLDPKRCEEWKRLF